VDPGSGMGAVERRTSAGIPRRTSVSIYSPDVPRARAVTSGDPNSAEGYWTDSTLVTSAVRIDSGSGA